MSHVTTISSREFNQDTGSAKRAANKGPVFITDRGRASHVLLTAAEYRRIIGTQRTLADALADLDSEGVEFVAPRIGSGIYRPADLS